MFGLFIQQIMTMGGCHFN